MADPMPHDLHPLCTLFPRMSGDEFTTLRADIRKHGLREPITLYDGMVLDGGNRYRACVEEGIEPVFTEFQGDDIVAFVLSANLHRRHLTPGQHAAIVASVTNWAGSAKVGRPRNDAPPASTVHDRAAMSGASVRTQRLADKLAQANPDLAKEVARGEVTLPAAVAKLDDAKPPKAKGAALHHKPEAPAEDLPDGDDLLADMEELRTRNAQLEAQVATIEAGNPAAEALRFQKLYIHAQAEQSAAMERATKATETRDWYARQLRRCGKAIGQYDPERIAAAVEAFVREHKTAKA